MPVCLQLERRGPAAFGSKFFANVCDATVVWGTRMRSLLFDQLAQHFSRLTETLSRDPVAVYEFEAPAQVAYDEVIQSKWIGTDR